MDEFFCCSECGHLLIGSKLEGDHNFCSRCEGADGKLKRVYPHDINPIGDYADPSDKHWISICGYSTTKGENKRLESLKLATLVQILNKESCCPNFKALDSLGPPKSDTRISHIRNHMILLIQHPKWSQNKEIRINDLAKYDEWIIKLDFEDAILRLSSNNEMISGGAYRKISELTKLDDSVYVNTLIKSLYQVDHIGAFFKITQILTDTGNPIVIKPIFETFVELNMLQQISSYYNNLIDRMSTESLLRNINVHLPLDLRNLLDPLISEQLIRTHRQNDLKVILEDNSDDELISIINKMM
jgi:hypothetical protein